MNEQTELSPEGEAITLEQTLVDFATDFYWWWHNAKGTNTRQGAEQYVKEHPDVVAAIEERNGRIEQLERIVGEGQREAVEKAWDAAIKHLAEADSYDWETSHKDAKEAFINTLFPTTAKTNEL